MGKKRGERGQLLNGLLLADEWPLEIAKRPDDLPPDFEVKLSSGAVVYVEVTESTIKEFAHTEATSKRVNDDLKLWLSSEASLHAKFAGLHMVLSTPVPIPERIREAALDEAKQFFIGVDLQTSNRSLLDIPQRVPPIYKLLSDLGCSVHCFASGDGASNIGMSYSRGWNPWHEAWVMRESISQKTVKAKDKNWTPRPLWLVVYVSTPLWDPSGIAIAFLDGGLESIYPFERVILAGNRQGLDISDRES